MPILHAPILEQAGFVESAREPVVDSSNGFFFVSDGTYNGEFK